MGKKAETWSEIVEPLVARFDIAAKFDQNAVWNPKGSRAMADLIKTMAEKLDAAVEMQLAGKPKDDVAGISA